MQTRVGGHADAVEDTRAHLLGFRRVPLLLPPGAIGRLLNEVLEARVVVWLFGVWIAVEIEVLQPNIQRIHPDRVRGAIDERLARERIIWVLRAAQRAVLLAVGLHVYHLMPQVVDLVHRFETRGGA